LIQLITVMKRVCWFFLLILLVVYLPGFTQEEGVLLKKQRVSKGKSVYLSGGLSFVFGNSSGDYSSGLNIEAGYLKRLNSFISIGPSLSYSSFNYDESISDSFGDASATGNNVYYNDADLEARVVYIQGGDLRFTTVGLTAKIDFIPFSDTRKFSVYGIVRPFLQVSKRTEISATAELWYYNTIPPDDPSNWTFSSEEFLSVNTAGLERWAAETEISGGFNTGVGGELSLPSGVSFFLQTSIGVTLPVSHINTSEFPQTMDGGYYNPDYPIVKSGFTFLSIMAGVSYSF